MDPLTRPEAAVLAVVTLFAIIGAVVLLDEIPRWWRNWKARWRIR